MEGDYVSCINFSLYNPVNEFEDEKERITPFFAFLDHTSSPCCVLSKDGEIMFSNKSWNIFVLEHNTTPSPHSFKGRNYFSLKDNAAPQGKEIIGGTQEISNFFDEIRSTFSPPQLSSEFYLETPVSPEVGASPLSPPSLHMTIGNFSPSFSYACLEPKKKIQIRYHYLTPKAEFEFKAKASKEIVEGKGYIVIKHEVVNLKKVNQPTDTSSVATQPVSAVVAAEALPLPRIEPVGLRVASLPPEERTISKLVKRVKEMDELFAVLDYCSSHCCLLNLKGEILFTNVAWNIFCVENGGDSSTNYKGYNYLTVSCTQSEDGTNEYSEDGGEYMGFLDGVKRLVAGHTLEEIQIEYPCHSDTEKRFFIATGYNVFLNNERYILISHELVCSQKIKKGERETTRTGSPANPSSQETACTLSSSSTTLTRQLPSSSIDITEPSQSTTTTITTTTTTTTTHSCEDKSEKKGTIRKADDLGEQEEGEGQLRNKRNRISSQPEKN